MYLLYRWVLVVYFLTWFLFYTIYEGPIIFIYITNWTYVVWCAYLTLSLVSMLVGVCQTHIYDTDQKEESGLELTDRQGSYFLPLVRIMWWFLPLASSPYSSGELCTLHHTLIWALYSNHCPVPRDQLCICTNFTGVVIKWGHFVYPLLYSLLL